MKNLLCIALFSIAIITNTAEKKEIVANNSKEIKIEKNAFEKEISEVRMFFGCGSDANAEYDGWIAEGYSHREARSLRRAWVRDCRGFGPDGWIGDAFGDGHDFDL